MDNTLRKAIEHLLGRLADHLVVDLLLIEVDWGSQTPPVSHEVVEITFQGHHWPLVYTDSELVLRRTLCQGRAMIALPGGNGPNFQIPRDVRTRADRNIPHQLGLRDRLYALTERDWPAEVDYADWRPSVERRLEALAQQVSGAGMQWNIQRNQLEAMLMVAAFGLEKIEGKDPAQMLAELSMAQRKQPTEATPLERDLLHGQLRAHQIAWADVLMWVVEESGRAEELTRTGLMMAAEQTAHYQPSWGQLNSLRARLINERGLAYNEAENGIIELATRALPYLHPSTRKAIVEAAEQVVLEILPKDTYNPWFPQLLKREIDRLAQHLARRDTGVLARVAELPHHLFANQDQPRLSVLAEMASLINQWQKAEPEVEHPSDVASLSRWYVEHGSKIDLAALRLSEQQGTGLDDSIQQLLSNYWHWRNKLNATFASQLLDHYEAALHDKDAGVFGVHRLLSWVVRPLLQRHSRVLLLIIDGMGCAAFWHLLQQWEQETPPVYTQASEAIQAALALLPSVTSVSRKGLFLDALPTDRLDDEQAYAEKAQTSEANALARAFPQYTTKLYNKSNLGSGQELLNDLQFQLADIVVAIFNAIDDDLKNTTPQVRLPHLRKDLGPLVNMVRLALEAGWTVLMTADHGHTWHRHKELRLGAIVPGGGERFKPLAKGDTPPAGAVVTADPHIVRVQTGEQVALLSTTGAYFGQQPRRGYHGGAGLEEVVVPCALLTLKAPAIKIDQTLAVTQVSAETLAAYEVSGLVLNLADGRIVSLELPFSLSSKEMKLLQALARLGEASEADLKQAINTRRIAGPLASLQERLALAGPDYEYIEQKGLGSDGAVYRFRVELLK